MNNMELNDKDDKLFELYTLAELAYQNHFRNIVKDEDLFPPKWYEKNNYREQTKKRKEAEKIDDDEWSKNESSILIHFIFHMLKSSLWLPVSIKINISFSLSRL